ncbi:MAG TPA: cation:proton antiporter [Burkholderiales bacterium]|nr:cation:proton antiporter [Burkholderiales bacterium]
MSAFDFLPPYPLPPNPVLLFGLLLLAGFAGGELAQRLRLPRITGYVVIGLLLGRSGLGLLDARVTGEAAMFVNLGVGVILFELGRRLDFRWLWRDRWFAATALAESSLAFFCVYAALAYFGVAPLHASMAAAIGVATSPAVVLLVAQELRAEGQVTERALNLVAINSVAAFVLATMLLSWVHLEQRASWLTMVLHPLYLLGVSLLLGYLASGATILLARWIGKREERQLVMLLAMIVLAVGCAAALQLSVMLSLLAFGVASRNLDRRHELMQVNVSHFGQIFFVVLFVVTGAILNIGDLINGGAMVLVYIAARLVGKSIGVLALTRFSGIRAASSALLCLALTPMSGLAVEMLNRATRLHPDFGTSFAATILSAILILELVGPVAVQFALKRAGEAHEATR